MRSESRHNRQVSTAARRIVVAINPNASFGKNASAGAQVAEAMRAEGHEVVELRRESFDALRDAARNELGLGAGLDMSGGNLVIDPLTIALPDATATA